MLGKACGSIALWVLLQKYKNCLTLILLPCLFMNWQEEVQFQAIVSCLKKRFESYFVWLLCISNVLIYYFTMIAVSLSVYPYAVQEILGTRHEHNLHGILVLNRAPFTPTYWHLWQVSCSLASPHAFATWKETREPLKSIVTWRTLTKTLYRH